MSEGGDGIWRRDEIDSPCVKICVLHPRARICIGCLRTGEEIAAWSRLSPERRAEIAAELPARAAQFTAPENRPSARPWVRAARARARAARAAREGQE